MKYRVELISSPGFLNSSYSLICSIPPPVTSCEFRAFEISDRFSWMAWISSEVIEMMNLLKKTPMYLMSLEF
jgi:hypothetical protein